MRLRGSTVQSFLLSAQFANQGISWSWISTAATSQILTYMVMFKNNLKQALTLLIYGVHDILALAKPVGWGERSDAQQ